MKVYLDTCCLHRPFDDPSQLRVAQETEAVLRILEACDGGSVLLVSSDALTLEVAGSDDSDRRLFAEQVLSKAIAHASLTDAIVNRGREFERSGVKPLDALHLAFAEAAGVDYFCSCDDKLLKKARAIVGLRIKVISLTDLAREIEP